MSRRKKLLERSDTSGSVAIEYGLILPAMLLFTLGIMDAGRLLWTNVTLTRATEAAARCYAVNTTMCPAGSVPAYAAESGLGHQRYSGQRLRGLDPSLRQAGPGDLHVPISRSVVSAVRFGAIRRRDHDAHRDCVLPESNLMAARDRRAELPAGPAAGDIVMSREPEVSAGQLDDTARERVRAKPRPRAGRAQAP